MARAWRANSLKCWVARVTRPVSCGRGETSENQTWSPFTNSSTPNRPRPPSESVTLPAMSCADGQRGGGHGLGLPALHIVALHLTVADGVAEVGDHLAVAQGAHRQQGDLEVEIDASLDDDPRRLDPAAGLGVSPGVAQSVRRLDIALALAGRGHHRLDEDRQADAVGRVRQLHRPSRRRRRALVGRPKLLGGQPADALAVHGQLGRPGGGDDRGQPVGLDGGQNVGGDGLDLGHDQMRALGLDDAAQGLRVGHGDDVAAVRHLHGRCVRIAVDGDHLGAQALQLDGHFLAQLARAQQHDPHGGGGKRGAEFHRGVPEVRAAPSPVAATASAVMPKSS